MLESVAVSPSVKTSADTPFPRPLVCCMGKKWGDCAVTKKERGSLTFDDRQQDMRTNVTG